MAVESGRDQELRNSLKRHSEELAGVYGAWFEHPGERPQFKGHPLVEHRVSGAALFFMSNGQTVLNPLVLPKDFARLAEPIKAHLGAENWKAWEGITRGVDSNLTAAVSLWGEIAATLATAARGLGLFGVSSPNDPIIVDRYWPELFIASIWHEPEYYEQKKAHSWESATIIEDPVTVSNSHQFDSFRTWIFAASNMVRSQSERSVEAMKKVWADEAARAEPLLRNLWAERARVEEETKAFQGVLRRFKSEYSQTSRVPGECSVCRPWLDQLNSPAVAPSSGALEIKT